VLKIAFYQTPQRKQNKIIKASTTPAKKQSKKSKYLCDTSSTSSSSEDDTTSPSPSKYVEANTFLANLSPTAKEVLQTISTSKKLVRHVKVVSETTNQTRRLVSLTMKLFFI
jgi:hypothetical protein